MVVFAQGGQGGPPGPGLDAKRWWLVALGVAAIVLLGVLLHRLQLPAPVGSRASWPAPRVGMMDMVRHEAPQARLLPHRPAEDCSVQAGVKVGTQELEVARSWAGGKLQPVVAAVIAAPQGPAWTCLAARLLRFSWPAAATASTPSR